MALRVEARLTQYDGRGTESLKSLSPTFHPSYPAVAFAFLNTVYFCTFVDGQSSLSIKLRHPSILAKLFAYLINDQQIPTKYEDPEISLFASAPVDSLEFSNEGDTLILFLSFTLEQMILQLPHKFRNPVFRTRKPSSMAHMEFESQQLSFLQPHSTEAPSESSELTNVHDDPGLITRATPESATYSLTCPNVQIPISINDISQSYPIGLFEGSHSGTFDNGMGLGWTSNVSDGTLDLRMWTASPDVSFSSNIELSKLPKWPGLTTAAISIKLPHNNNPLVYVYMNKRADQWSDMLTPVDEHLPAILLRPSKEVEKSKKTISYKYALPNNGSLENDLAFNGDDQRSGLSMLVKKYLLAAPMQKVSGMPDELWILNKSLLYLSAFSEKISKPLPFESGHHYMRLLCKSQHMNFLENFYN